MGMRQKQLSPQTSGSFLADIVAAADQSTLTATQVMENGVWLEEPPFVPRLR